MINEIKFIKSNYKFLDIFFSETPGGIRLKADAYSTPRE